MVTSILGYFRPLLGSRNNNKKTHRFFSRDNNSLSQSSIELYEKFTNRIFFDWQTMTGRWNSPKKRAKKHICNSEKSENLKYAVMQSSKRQRLQRGKLVSFFAYIN